MCTELFNWIIIKNCCWISWFKARLHCQKRAIVRLWNLLTAYSSQLKYVMIHGEATEGQQLAISWSVCHYLWLALMFRKWFRFTAVSRMYCGSVEINKYSSLTLSMDVCLVGLKERLGRPLSTVWVTVCAEGEGPAVEGDGLHSTISSRSY